MIVLNGEPFIEYNLISLYPHAHEILIVEGAVERFAHAATSDGHSVDNTVDIIRAFPDPDKKIKLIQYDGFWPEKDEMSNAYMDACTGDYIWQVDVDEFYKSEDIEKVRLLLTVEPGITQVNIKTINFWRGFASILQGATYIFGCDEFIRIFRYKPGYKYLTHRPPTLVDEKGQEYQHSRVVCAQELLDRCGVYIYHYSYVMPNYVRNKANYYAKMNWGGGHEDGDNWYVKNWKEISNPLRVHIIKYPPSWIVPFEGSHPPVINKLLSDISFVEHPEVTNYLRHDYIKYKLVGEVLSGQIKRNCHGMYSRIKSVCIIISQLLFPLRERDIRANYSIVYAAIKLLRRKS